jgi:hypothetical protein
LVGENIHRYPVSLTGLECQVSGLANSDTCPRPTTVSKLANSDTCPRPTTWLSADLGQAGVLRGVGLGLPMGLGVHLVPGVPSARGLTRVGRHANCSIL